MQIATVRDDDEHDRAGPLWFVKVDQRPDESPDKWHRFESAARGPAFPLSPTGSSASTTTSGLRKEQKTRALRGYIGLEDCGLAKGRYVEFRNIRIKPLD